MGFGQFSRLLLGLLGDGTWAKPPEAEQVDGD